MPSSRRFLPTSVEGNLLWYNSNPTKSSPAKTPSLLSFEDEAEETTRNVFIEDGNQCFVCLENFNDQQNQPMIMPCGHIVCNACLIQLAKTFQYEKIKCPLDNQIYKVKRSERRGNEYRATIPSTRSLDVRDFMQDVQDTNFMPNDPPSGSHLNTDSIYVAVNGGKRFHNPPTQLHVAADVHDDRFHNPPTQLYVAADMHDGRMFCNPPTKLRVAADVHGERRFHNLPSQLLVAADVHDDRRFHNTPTQLRVAADVHHDRRFCNPPTQLRVAADVHGDRRFHNPPTQLRVAADVHHDRRFCNPPTQLRVAADVHDDRRFYNPSTVNSIHKAFSSAISKFPRNAPIQNSRFILPRPRVTLSSSRNIPVNSRCHKPFRNTGNPSRYYNDKWLPEPVPDYAAD
ncbi:uncharacterized protein LOC133184801 [Saccostrea echinata]|uniref:uncharacterized protein LOC133184801 n=1 Tax=Saccostrea echinata TaxID=191078 RepID=UPI002A81B397|nr:uncharacterized protein LOC133184801 [Saccostrea echinata]XP_061175860.1 uncharacterized protein LOC133184801 [Saccostrea echinata]